MTLLDAFWLLRNSAEGEAGTSYSQRSLSGRVPITTEVIGALKIIEDAGVLTNLWVDESLCRVSALSLGGTAKFQASAPRGYFENVDELIRRHRFNPPEDLRVFEFGQEETLLKQYRQAANLAALLSRLAISSSAEGCTIMAKTQLEIPFEYSTKELCDRPQIDGMLEKLNPNVSDNPEAKRMLDLFCSLFIQSVYDVVGSAPKPNRFSRLLESFPECVFRFNLAFRCFSDEANKALERYEEKRAGMISALNGVLGNIQTSLIGIPLAGMLALKEIKPADGLSFQNLMICLAVLMVGALLLALSFSQGKTLDAIGEQELQLRNEIENCGGEETKTGKLLKSMSNHHSLVYTLLKTVRFILVVFMLTSIGAAAWSSFSEVPTSVTESNVPETIVPAGSPPEN